MNTDTNQPPIRVHQIVWGALLLSQFVIAALPSQVVPPLADPSGYRYGIPDFNQSIDVIFAAIAVLITTASFLVPKFLSANFFTSSIVGYALLEQVVLVGLAQSFMKGDSTYVYPYILVASLAMIARFPTSPTS